MNLKSLIVVIMLILSSITFAQQKYDVYPITSQYPFNLVRDMSFVDLSNGYLTAVKYVYSGNNYVNDVNYVFKTTNSGANWTKVWEYTYEINSKKPTVSFINANTGYISKRTELKKTTNGGQNWTNINTSGLNNNFDNLICTRSNGDLFLLQVDASTIFKYSISTGTFQVIKNFGSGYSIKHFEISKFNDNNIYVCGYHLFGSTAKPFLAKSTDAGVSWEYKIDGDNDPNGIGSLQHLSVTNDGFNDVVKIGGISKLIEFKNNQVNILNNNWGADLRFAFGDANNGYYLSYDGATDDPPQSTGIANAYKTTDGGQTWITDLEINSAGHFLNSSYRFFSKGNIVYLTESVDGAIGYFRVRNLSENILTYHDNISNTGSFKINNILNNTPDTKYIRGGSFPLWTEPTLNQGQTDEKIFYKWSFNSMRNSVNNYDLFYEGGLATLYKTKLKADNAWAINNANQTKAIRDTNSVSNGTIHQVCESIGGIFYSFSSNGGSNFSREEIVNFGTSDIDAYGNRNPSITIKRRDFYPLTIYDQNRNVAVVWERFNQSTGKTDILVADRVLDIYQTGYEWKKYEDGYGNNIFATFNSTAEFQSTPKIFVSSPLTNLYNSIIIVPHLEKDINTNKTKVVITIRNQNNRFDYVVDNGETGTISNLAVSSPYNEYNVYGLHIVYQKDNTVNNIVYKKVIAGRDPFNGLYAQTLETVDNLGNGDGMRARFTPDISVQNGLPVVTYCGNYFDNRIIHYEDETVNDNMLSLLKHTTITRFKTTINGAWSEYARFTGLNPQENPNVEGSKNAMAYLLSFRKNGLYFQYVKINGLQQTYYCNPGSYPETDAKFVRGSYIGQFGSIYNPILLTLSNPDVNSRYSIGQQAFSINPYSNGTDGFDNLSGIIEKDNTQYSLTLGPIIASNTTFGFEDDTPPQTVHNPVEFNETMVSAVFSLSNNDTLILGAHGKYTSAGQSLQPLKYHVNLVNSNSGQIHRELFRDTINIEDSVGIEFLRGYVINNIANGTDQFFVQMVVDTVDAAATDYAMSGVYADNTPPQGDAPHSYKTKVFFENGSNPLTNVGNQLPKDYALSQNYPNPFNPSTTIKFALPKDGFVTLKIYDLAGREVARLVSEVKKAGYHDVLFNASNLASGVYFYRIQSNDFVMTKRMVLIK